MISVLFFGQLKDRLKTGRIEVSAKGVGSVAALKQKLESENQSWKAVFEEEGQQLLAAVNQEMGNDRTAVSDGDEVALFPPVTGG